MVEVEFSLNKQPTFEQAVNIYREIFDPHKRYLLADDFYATSREGVEVILNNEFSEEISWTRYYPEGIISDNHELNKKNFSWEFDVVDVRNMNVDFVHMDRGIYIERKAGLRSVEITSRPDGASASIEAFLNFGIQEFAEKVYKAINNQGITINAYNVK